MSRIEAFNLIGNTPMVHLKTLDPKPGVEIHAKLEFMNPTGSIKDRIISYIVQKGIDAGHIHDDTTLVNITPCGRTIALDRHTPWSHLDIPDTQAWACRPGIHHGI